MTVRVAENKGTYILKAWQGPNIEEGNKCYPKQGDVGGRYEGKWARVGN